MQAFFCFFGGGHQKAVKSGDSLGTSDELVQKVFNFCTREFLLNVHKLSTFPSLRNPQILFVFPLGMELGVMGYWAFGLAPGIWAPNGPNRVGIWLRWSA